jgi:predicted permease
MIENVASFWNDLKVSIRALARAKGLSATVVLTLALGIGANTAIFSLLRGVLLRPLVNRDEDRLIYIRQSSGSINANFSVPEIDDLRARIKSLSAFGDFSTIALTMIGLGEPRTVHAGVVGGSYFQVMGLRPVLGRLLDERDDGPKAAGAVVLTYRFWSTTLKSDPAVLGKVVRLDSFVDARPATVVGILEPCVPYPQDTEIIANVVTSAHHLSATMVTSRLHRMTELFGRLAPGADLQTVRTELAAVYGGIQKEHSADYPARDDYHISAVRLRDQLTSDARTILLVLMAGSILVFVIACSNVANLILARTVRRENELAIRMALGAGTGALRRALLTDSLLLAAGGAALGILIAGPLLSVLARYIARCSVRALDLTLDSSMLWVGAGLAVLAAALLAFVPRLPSPGSIQRFGRASIGTRVTGIANRKLRAFAIVQIAASFVLVTAAGATLKTLLALQSARTGFDTRQVLTVTVPVMHEGRTLSQVADFYREAARRIKELPGVQNVSVGGAVPWLDADGSAALQFAVDNHVPADDEEVRRARVRIVMPGFFATLGLPLLDGRDFNESDLAGREPVAIISQSIAQKMFPGTGAVNHYVVWTDPILKSVSLLASTRLRVVGVVPDMDDVDLPPKPAMTIYRPFEQEIILAPGNLFVHANSDPHALVTPVTRIIRAMSADQPVERAGTLEDVRAEVLSPERLNVMVSAVFAGVALLIAVVGVAGVLAFSVSGRTREFGIRLAVGSQPRHLLLRVMTEGAVIAIAGLAVGFACGYWLAQLAGSWLGGLQVPGAWAISGSALVLLLAAVTASLAPAARAARVDVIQALRSE